MKLDVYETGISNHHEMIFSVLRKNFPEGTAKLFSTLALKSMIKTLPTKYFKAKFNNLTTA